MKSKLLIIILAALALSSCEQKHKAIRNELLLIQRTTNDPTQPDYIRESKWGQRTRIHKFSH